MLLSSTLPSLLYPLGAIIARFPEDRFLFPVCGVNPTSGSSTAVSKLATPIHCRVPDALKEEKL